MGGACAGIFLHLNKMAQMSVKYSQTFDIAGSSAGLLKDADETRASLNKDDEQ